METRKLAAIMFTDMVGYSKNMQENEDRALALLHEHNTVLQDQIRAHNGKIIKTIGDAFLAEFDSANNAVKTAVEIQKALAVRNARQPASEPIEVRIGIHVGDIVYRDNDVFGDGVNIASRIESIASSGQIFISGNVHSIIHGKLDFFYHDYGVQNLKNISQPINVYEVVWDPFREQEPPLKSAKKSRFSASVKVALAVVPVCIVLIAIYLIQSTGQRAASKPPLTIIGFSDQTGEESLANLHLGKIITDALIQKFYNWPQIQLVSPFQMSKAMKANQIDDTAIGTDLISASEIAKTVNARFMITGSINKLDPAAQTLRITSNLNDINSEQLLLSHSTEGGADKILVSMIDDIANQLQLTIARAGNFDEDVKPIAGIGELTTNSLEAYSHYYYRV